MTTRPPIIKPVEEVVTLTLKFKSISVAPKITKSGHHSRFSYGLAYSNTEIE